MKKALPLLLVLMAWSYPSRCADWTDRQQRSMVAQDDCTDNAIKELDDHTSDAKTISEAVFAKCFDLIQRKISLVLPELHNELLTYRERQAREQAERDILLVKVLTSRTGKDKAAPR